jgi:hypothetical protein
VTLLQWSSKSREGCSGGVLFPQETLIFQKKACIFPFSQL